MSIVILRFDVLFIFFLFLTHCLGVILHSQSPSPSLPSSPLPSPILSPSSTESITCANIDQVKVTSHLAAGAVKLVSEGVWRQEKVLIVHAHNGTFYRTAHTHADFAQKLVDIFAAERDHLRAIRRDNVVPLLGGCWDVADAARVALVVPYLQTWSTVVADDRLGLVARLFIAASAIDLARLFDRFPLVSATGNLSNTSVVLHDTSGRSFGVTGDYQVKLFALADRLIFRNHSRAYGDDQKCDSDDACRAFFASDAGGAFPAVHSGAPRDFDCNLAARRCWGLDSRTNVYTICRTMLRPLLALSERAKVPLALARDRATYGNTATTELQQLMWQCEANNPHDRISASALQKSLRALATRFGGEDAEHLPPFEPSNPAASGYVSLQELSKAALTAGALEEAERAAAALVENDIVVRLPKGNSGRRQWLKEHVDANGDLDGSVDSLGRWHPHAEFYNPPIVLTEWFFRLALSPDMARSPERPVLRLAGVAGEQSWLSSPVRHWISARELSTSNGKRYILHGAVDCKGLKSVGFADRMCALFHDGFPRDWLAVVQPVWDQLKKSAEAQQLLNDALLPPQLYKDVVELEQSGERPTPRPRPMRTKPADDETKFHCRGNRHKCELEFKKWQAAHAPPETDAPTPAPTTAPPELRPPPANVACFQFKTCSECNEPRRWHRMSVPSECAWCPSVRACVARASVLQTCPAPLLDVAVCETEAPTPLPTAPPTPLPTPAPTPAPPRTNRPTPVPAVRLNDNVALHTANPGQTAPKTLPPRVSLNTPPSSPPSPLQTAMQPQSDCDSACVDCFFSKRAQLANKKHPNDDVLSLVDAVAPKFDCRTRVRALHRWCRQNGELCARHVYRGTCRVECQSEDWLNFGSTATLSTTEALTTTMPTSPAPTTTVQSTTTMATTKTTVTKTTTTTTSATTTKSPPSTATQTTLTTPSTTVSATITSTATSTSTFSPTTLPVTTALTSSTTRDKLVDELFAVHSVLETRCGSARSGWLHKPTGACCGASCGACDDTSECVSRGGGTNECCATTVLAGNATCGVERAPPCVVRSVDIARAPKAMPSVTLCPDRGLLSRDGRGTCCAASCGTCETNDCASRPGGRIMCCPISIARLGVQCTTQNTSPCVLKHKPLPTEMQNK